MICHQCETYDVELKIAGPRQLSRILKKIQKAVVRQELSYNSFESSRALIGQDEFMNLSTEAPFPDVFVYYFDCLSCGSVFELSGETCHGQGASWKRLR